MSADAAASQASRGFTYLGVLFIISLLGLTAAMASVVWSAAQQRENERQLVFAGLQFQNAIERYSTRAQAQQRHYPRQLDELLRDPRALGIQRDLRKIYVDPITGDKRWGLVRLPDGGIVGVYSLSDRQPLRTRFPSDGASGVKMADTYRDWRFIAPSAVDLLSPVAPPDASASGPADAASAEVTAKTLGAELPASGAP